MLKAASEGTSSAFLGSHAAGRARSWRVVSTLGSHPGTGMQHGADSAPLVILHFADRPKCLQSGNYLNKDHFSFAGVIEKSSHKTRIFSSD